MNLLETLNRIEKNGKIAVYDRFALGIIYEKDLNCFVWCTRDGIITSSSQDVTGMKRVILSPTLLRAEKWKEIEKTS